MNKYLKKLYSTSPIWFQNVMISQYGKKLYKQRYGEIYQRELKKNLEKDYSDFEKEQKYQNQELRKFISYAVKNSIFYKRFYKGIDISKVQTVNDLHLLPILDKETFRKNIEDIYTIPERGSKVSFTGGTTGKAIKVFFTIEDAQKRMAYLDAFKFRLGIDPFKMKKATFSGKEYTNDANSKKKNIFWRHNSTYNQRLYSTFDLSEENIPYYIKDLNQYKPEVLNGFVSAYYELAKFIESRNSKLEFVPKAIFTTSETLLPFHREIIERVFKAKIYNQYASGEGACFITECIDNNLHYNLDTGVIEKYATQFGDEMLITSFSSHGTPLIRYRIGDKITFLEGECTCGSSHPIVGNIEGRQVDFLFSTERGKISLSHLADVIKGMPNNIVNMQFVQYNMEEITIKLVVDKDLYKVEDEKLIFKEMIFRFGKQTKVKIEYVDEIKREKSGKFALIKNLIKEQN